MAKPTLNVIYPKGFLDKPLLSGRPDSKAFCEKWKAFRAPEQSLNIIEETLSTTLEELILNFNKIINTYKSNPEQSLALNTIYKILTNEESVIKNALSKLDGTKGRCVISKTVTSVFRSYEYVSYNPNLKETKKQLLILFNKFKQTNDTNKSDIIMYEDKPLFIHLFSIVIDSLNVPEPDGKKKDCTNIFPMITLLELLLNKKYKTILEHKINNIPLPISDDNDECKGEGKGECKGEGSGDDDKWDKDDFEPVITTKTTELLQTPHPEPEPEIIIPSVTKNDNDLSIEKNDENKTEEIPDDWDTI